MEIYNIKTPIFERMTVYKIELPPTYASVRGKSLLG